MSSLYVAYSAATKDGNFVNGWVTIAHIAEPQSTAEIKSLCDRIGGAENLNHVVPIWWRGIPQN